MDEKDKPKEMDPESPLAQAIEGQRVAYEEHLAKGGKPLAGGITPDGLLAAFARGLQQGQEEHEKMLKEEPSFKEGEGVDWPVND
jgi:hypothetical protein